MPFNPSQAGREFRAVRFMVGDTSTTMTVTGTAFLRARAVDALGRLGLLDRFSIRMSTGHSPPYFRSQKSIGFSICGQWVMGYCFIRLCDYILLASQLSVKFKTFRCEAIGLFWFMRDSRVREINKATFPCRSPIVVNESMATLLAHS